MTVLVHEAKSSFLTGLEEEFAMSNELAMSKGECNEGKCWCVSNGGETCLATFDGSWTGTEWNYGSIECAGDRCINPGSCSSRGYWCDDSLLKDNEGNKCLLKGIPLMSISFYTAKH